jgi:hypothetical protein
MEFLSPYFLYGLIFLGLPLILHFVRRRRYREVVFPAIRFLLQSYRQRSRSLQLNRILLLLLRFLMVALIALAFARPAFRLENIQGITDSRGTALIILDDSASMAVGSSAGTPIASALQEIEKILNSMGPGELAGVISTTGGIRVSPSSSQKVKKMLESVRVSPMAGDSGRAIAEALALRDGAGEGSFRIFLISDFQNSDFNGMENLPAGITPIRVGSGRIPDNAFLRVSDVRTPVGSVTPGQDFTIGIVIDNLGTTLAEELEMTVRIGEREQSVKVPAIDPGQQVTVSITTGVDSSGHHPGRVWLNDSGDFPLSSRRNFVIRAHGTLYSLLVGSAPWRLERDAPTFFLGMGLNPMAAINPGAAAAKGSTVPVAINLSSLLQQNLDGFNAIFLAGVSNAGSEQVRVLEEFVRRGGALVILPGRGADPMAMDRNLKSILPARITGELKIDAGEPLRMGVLDQEHPLMVPFGKSALEAFSAANFTRALSLGVNPLDRDVKVIAGFDEQAPAIVEGRIGLGRVILTAFSGDMDWGDLPLQSVFPALMGQMMSYLCHSRDGYDRVVDCGSMITLRLPLGSDRPSVTAQAPDGTVISAVTEPTPTLFIAQLGPVREEGHYEIVTDRSGRLEKGLVAANPPSSEYVLTYLSADRIRGTDRMDGTSIRTLEIWRWLLIAMIFLACIELTVANRYLTSDNDERGLGITGRQS